MYFVLFDITDEHIVPLCKKDGTVARFPCKDAALEAAKGTAPGKYLSFKVFPFSKRSKVDEE